MVRKAYSDIPFFKPDIGPEEIAEVNECLKSGWLTTGKRTKQFESDFAEFVGLKHAVALNSCTAALHLALESLGLRENELVLVPTMTFAATAEVVRYFNAIPVLVDVMEDDLCMDMNKAGQILEAISEGRKLPGIPEEHGPARGIIPVHYGGQVADIENCRRLCDKYGLFMVEDCAHCCPAYYRDSDGIWRMAGKSADVACYSFYANKTITTGEGGMAATDRQDLEDRIRIMSLHGISKDAWKRFSKEGSWYYEISAPGYKYNMSDLAAAIGIHQLRKAQHFLKQRAEIADIYSAELSGIEGLALPVQKKDRKHSWHLYAVRIDKKKNRIQRNELIEKLKEEGIGSSVHYIPLHMHPYYIDNYGYRKEDFPVAAKAYEGLISLPVYPGMTEEQALRVTETIKRIIDEK